MSDPQDSQKSASATPNESSAELKSIKHRFLWHAHEYQSEYVRHADAKATFSAGIAAASLGFLYHENTHLPWNQPCSCLVVAWFSFFFSAVASAILVASLFCAFFAVSPLLPHKHSSQKSDGFIYWKNIADHENFDKLEELFDQQNIDALNNSILHHIWDISTLVLVPKYSRIRWCVRLLAIGVFLAGISLALNPHHYDNLCKMTHCLQNHSAISVFGNRSYLKQTIDSDDTLNFSHEKADGKDRLISLILDTPTLFTLPITNTSELLSIIWKK